MTRVDKLVYHLRGTCMSLEKACADFGFDSGDLTMTELEELDSLLFYCDNCGWWYDVDELACIGHSKFQDDNICIHCAPEFYDNGYEQY